MVTFAPRRIQTSILAVARPVTGAWAAVNSSQLTATRVSPVVDTAATRPGLVAATYTSSPAHAARKAVHSLTLT